MSIEFWLLIGIITIIIFAVIAFVWYEREQRRKQELWEIELYDLIAKVQKKVDQLTGQISYKITEEFSRVDENTQKRHNYLKKSFNEIADRLDILEQTEKGVKDLYYQFERSYSKLTDILGLMPKSIQPAQQEEQPSTANPFVPVMDEEVSKMLQLYSQGMSAEQIAQNLGKAIPEVQLALHLFTSRD